MKEIYTPKAWLSIFGGSPKLIIDNDGYIYSYDGYYKFLRDNPIGRIDYRRGYIYGENYADWFPTPIAEIRERDGVTEVHEYGRVFSTPMFYIKNGEIYEHREYIRFFGGTPSGYVKTR